MGGNIGGTDRLSHWPPNFTTGRENGQAAARLHAVLNPEKYQGEVYGVADDHCVVYSTGKRDCAKAFVLISFDPSIRLHNLEKGNSTTSTANDTFTSDLTDGTSWDTPKLRVETSIHLEAQRLAGAEVERSLTPRKRKRSPLICPGPEEAILHGQRHSSRTLLDAFWCEPAMYLRIRQGLDFSS